MNQWNKIYKEEGKEYRYYNILEPHEDMDRIVKWFKKYKVQNVFDLGCGAGRNLIFLAEKGFNLSGMDLAPEGLRLIKESLVKKKLKADLKVGSFYKKLPYSNERFDAVISVQALQHGTEKEILTAIKEVGRVLKPGGLIFVTLCGRLSNGKVRLFLVKTAKKIAQNTYQPTQGKEEGLTHFIYNKTLIAKHFKNFKMLDLWKDNRDYYCFIAKLK